MSIIISGLVYVGVFFGMFVIGCYLFEFGEDMMARISGSYPIHSYLTPEEMNDIRKEMEK